MPKENANTKYKVIERNSVKMEVPVVVTGTVTEIGRGGHVMVPQTWIGDEVEVINKTKSKK